MPYKEFDVDGIGKVKIYKRKRNRSLRLTVAADGDVHVTIPLWAPYQAGVAFTLSKRSWILTHSQQQVFTLVDGQRIGKSHHLFFRQGINDGVRTSVRQTEIIVTYGPELEIDDIRVQLAARDACLRALRSQAQVLLVSRLSQLSLSHNVTYKSLSIKRMRSRWGSCDQERNIVLNLYLVQLPWEFIDYVILHELTHTKVLHHGEDFWNELESLLPKARQLRKAMKTYRPTILVA